MIYGETGTLPISYHIKSRMINVFMRLPSGKQSKLSCIMYKMWRQKSELGFKFEWIITVSLSLKHFGMYDTWLFNGNGFTANYIKKAVKLRTMDMMIQEWYNDQNDDIYYGIYNVIKNDWKFEQYLTDLNLSQIVAMCKFRCHSNHLPISQARFIDDILVDVDCLCPFGPGQIGDRKLYSSWIWWPIIQCALSNLINFTSWLRK